MAFGALRIGSIVQVVALVTLVTAAPPLRGQEPGSGNVQRRVAELKQAVAANKAKLRQYQWLQTTEVSVKGETKKEQQQQVRYGPDGTLVKTPVGEPEQPQQQARGLKGRIVTKKVDEMKDYIERTKTLIAHYVPPDAEMMQASLQAGKASVNPGAAMTTIIFTDYYKPGDKVTFGFDTTAKKVRSYDISTYLDDPVKDVVTVTNRFAALPDGTNYLQQTILDMSAKRIQITTTNSGQSRVD